MGRLGTARRCAPDLGVVVCPPPALGGSTSESHTEKKGGAYDGGRYTEYCTAGAGLSGPLRLEQSVRPGSTPARPSRRGPPRRVALHRGGKSAAIPQLGADVWHGRMVVLRVVVSAAQRQAFGDRVVPPGATAGRPDVPHWSCPRRCRLGQPIAPLRAAPADRRYFFFLYKKKKKNLAQMASRPPRGY